MRKVKFSIILLFLTISIFAQKNCQYQIDENKILENRNLDFFLTKIKNDKFATINNIKAIPTKVKHELDCITGKFSIANPNQKYQVGCIRERGVPNRQLIFLAKSADVLIMSYATGGIGSSTHFLFIKYNSQGIIDLWTGIGMGIIKHKSLEEITKYIALRRNKEWGLNTNIVSI